MAEAVLFDFGGTLDADGVTWKERLRRLFRDEGVVVSSERFDPLYFAVDDGLVGSLPPTLPLRDTVRRLVDGVAAALGCGERALVDRVISRFGDDALLALSANVPLLAALSRRYRLGIVSNFYGNLAAVCEDAGIAPYFAALVDSTRVGATKPDPRIFRHALAALGTAPADALFVGDSLPRDMAGARGVGMRHVWLVEASAAPAAPCCPGDRVVHSLRALEELLL